VNEGGRLLFLIGKVPQHQETQNDQEIGPFSQVGIKSSLIEMFSIELEISF
jgi:hypothetical protein